MTKNPGDYSFSRTKLVVFLFVSIAALTLTFFYYLYFYKPFYMNFRGWFFPYKIKEIRGLVPAVYSFSLCFCLPFFLYRNPFKKSHLLLIYLAGVSLQFSFALMEGKGIYPVLHNIRSVGHKEFGHLAAKVDSTYELVAHYGKVKDRTNDGFVESKPPGSLLFYYITKNLSDFLFPFIKDSSLILLFMQILASFLWPFVSLLVLLPLFFLGKLYFNQEVALTACLIYIFIPMTTLITMHLDQVLYPFLFVSCLLVGSHGSVKNNSLLLCLTGFFTYLASFFSFGLLTVFPFILIIYFLTAKNFLQSLKFFSMTLIGFFSFYFFMFFFLDYDLYQNYQEALAHSRSWEKATHFSLRHLWLSSCVNFFEFSTYLGIPLFSLFFLKCLIDSKELLKSLLNRDEIASQLVFSIGTIFVIFLMQLIQRNTAEIIRLWLFTTTLIALSSSLIIHKFFKEYSLKFLSFFLSFQWFCIFILKMRNDF